MTDKTMTSPADQGIQAAREDVQAERERLIDFEVTHDRDAVADFLSFVLIRDGDIVARFASEAAAADAACRFAQDAGALYVIRYDR